MNAAELDEDLRAAHRAGDAPRLVTGYARAAALADAAGEVNRAAFFRTQAWVFALEAGDARAGALRARLAADGREDNP